MKSEREDYISRAKKVLTIEAEAVLALQSEIDDNFLQICERL